MVHTTQQVSRENLVVQPYKLVDQEYDSTTKMLIDNTFRSLVDEPPLSVEVHEGTTNQSPVHTTPDKCWFSFSLGTGPECIVLVVVHPIVTKSKNSVSR